MRYGYDSTTTPLVNTLSDHLNGVVSESRVLSSAAAKRRFVQLTNTSNLGPLFSSSKSNANSPEHCSSLVAPSHVCTIFVLLHFGAVRSKWQKDPKMTLLTRMKMAMKTTAGSSMECYATQ